MGSNKDYRKCPDCGKIGFVHKEGEYKTISYERGTPRELSVENVEWDECELCGAKYLNSEAIKKITDAKYKSQGLYTPNEIAEIRKCLGLSQKEIAKLLKVGEKTFTRWEKGNFFQSKSLNESIKNLVIQYNLPFDIREDEATKKIREKISANLKKEPVCESSKPIAEYKKLFPGQEPVAFNPRIGLTNFV